jgi:hypothetical protein
MLKRRTVILLCGGFFIIGFVSGLSFLGFASILVTGTHATGYSQPINSDLSPAQGSPTVVFSPTPCPPPTPSPTPPPPPTFVLTPSTTPTPPVLGVVPTSLVFNVPPGTSASQLIRITNIGGGRLDWIAALPNGTPSYISISPSSVSGLAGGATVFITVTVDATKLAGGAFTTSVTITAIDPITGQSVAGSPSTVNIHLTITSSRSTGSPTPSFSPTPVLCPTPSPTPSPTPTPTPEEGLGFAQK